MDFDCIPSPCFVVDEKKLRQNLSTLRALAKSADVQIIHALKAFASYPVFPIIKEYLPTCSASSLDEARLCYEHFGQKAHLYSPAYLDFEELSGYASHLIFNSLSQLERFGPRASGHELGLRLNPECSEALDSKYDPCLLGSRLGVTAEVLGDQHPVDGYHIHALCEGSAEALAKIVRALEAKFSSQLERAKWLNLGGGHLITDAGYNLELLRELLNSLKSRFELNLILEPGAAVVWQAGYLVTEVQDIVTSGGIKTAIIDASFTAHMPDCLEMPYQPKIVDAVESSEHKYRLGGVSCLAADYLGDYYFPSPLEVGQRLVFCDMLHYTMVKTTNFNGVKHPALGIWRDGFRMLKEFGHSMYCDRLG